MNRSRLLERVLIAVAVLSLGYCAFAILEAEVYDLVQTRRLENMRADEPTVTAAMAASVARSPVVRTAGAAPEPAAAPFVATATREEADENGFVGRIEIERLGVAASITEGVKPRALRRAVGHVPGTAFPGESGNVGIAGHRDRHFRGLRDIKAGDEIWVTSPDGDFTYVVEDIWIVEPDAVHVLDPTQDPTLTLVTCYPFWYLGNAPQRFIVRARLDEADEPVAAAATR